MKILGISVSRNFEKCRINLYLLDKCLFYITKNHYIGCNRYMEKISYCIKYIRVISYIYSAWAPYFEPRWEDFVGCQCSCDENVEVQLDQAVELSRKESDD